MYYDNGSEYNVKDMDTVVINTKYGTLYVLTELNHLVLMRILEKQSKWLTRSSSQIDPNSNEETKW